MPTHFFTGPNQYMLNETLTKWSTQFKSKYGSQGYYHFNAEQFDLKIIIESLSSNGLFQEKKMVVISGIPADKQTENAINTSKIEDFLHRYEWFADYIDDNNTMVIFVSINPDKRTRWYKYICTHSNNKEFKLFSPKELIWRLWWMIWWLVSNETMTYMIDAIGQDMYHLKNETNKLIQFAWFHTIPKLTLSDVKKLIRSQEDSNVFKIVHTMISNPSDAYTEIQNKQQLWENRNKYHGWLMRWIRVLLLVIESYLDNHTSSSEISQQTNISTRTVSTILKQYTIDQWLKIKIQYLFKTLIWLEYNIKTGITSKDQYWLMLKQSTTTIQSLV
jgi:DNA polymerase III delta subunit